MKIQQYRTNYMTGLKILSVIILLSLTLALRVQNHDMQFLEIWPYFWGHHGHHGSLDQIPPRHRSHPRPQPQIPKEVTQDIDKLKAAIIDSQSHRQKAIQCEGQALRIQANILRIIQQNDIQSLAQLWRGSEGEAVRKQTEKLSGEQIERLNKQAKELRKEAQELRQKADKSQSEQESIRQKAAKDIENFRSQQQSSQNQTSQTNSSQTGGESENSGSSSESSSNAQASGGQQTSTSETSAEQTDRNTAQNATSDSSTSSQATADSPQNDKETAAENNNSSTTGAEASA